MRGGLEWAELSHRTELGHKHTEGGEVPDLELAGRRLPAESLVPGMANALWLLPWCFSVHLCIKPSLSNTFRQAGEDGDPELVPAVVIKACQLLCFPFALEVDGDTLALVTEAVRDSQIPAQLLQVPSWPCVSMPLHTLWRHLSALQPLMRGTISHHAGSSCAHRDVM